MKILNMIKQIKSQSISMQRRFAVYIISAIAMILSLILLLLNIFGIINPTNTQIMNRLDTLLASHADNIEHDYDKVAAYAISFSKQLENEIQNYLIENNLSFDELKDNPEALTELQDNLYDIVYLNMQVTPSSGTFYILDTTVNSSSEEQFFNGIYLKYINLYSESTVNNDISLYRGSYYTGKNANLTFHSGWQNEMRTNFFEDSYSYFPKGIHYQLSNTVEIPETWERARYVYVPIRNLEENIIGICGFEISDLYFQLSQKTNTEELEQVVCALLDENAGSYCGQFNSNKYNNLETNTFTTTTKGNATYFNFNSEKCIGKTKEIQLGNSTFAVALMITEAQYNKYISEGQFKIVIISICITIFSFICCLFLSKKFVMPISDTITQFKSSEEYNKQLKIREIDDLFAFLEERDNLYEEKLEALKLEKESAEKEATLTKISYEKALEKYELAKCEIEKISEEQKKELNLEEYEYFIQNVTSLTPTEKKIYELYLDGKTAKDILNILTITENTLKYHNKNIYSKLGISSRKQLIRYASLKQYQDSKETL